MSDDAESEAKAALRSWVGLGITRRKAKSAAERVEQRRLAFLSACEKSQDGNVREALRGYLEAQRLARILAGEEEP